MTTRAWRPGNLTGAVCVLALSVLHLGCASGGDGQDQGPGDADMGPQLDCADTPCGNFGRCTMDPVLGGVCECLPWRVGRTCETFDFCFDASCGNGTCVNGETGFTCACDAGFTGPDCTADVNECGAANACSGHGTCSNQAPGFTCSCDPGFSGPACATNVDDCASLSCGSGTCVDEIGRAHCSCPTGTGGASCNVPADDCSPSPCVRGTCVLNASAFGSCTCPAGFTGTYCEQSVDDCAAATCANGSRCQDGDSTYTCVGCVGYTGQDCDVPVTCASAPPAAPANGTAGTATGSSFGDTVTYDCDGNFRMLGSATSSCGADGEWTPAPTCECESHVLTYDLTGDYYIFAPVVDPFRAAAGENLPAINTLPFGPGHMTLRVSANGDATGDGPVSILSMFLPLEFQQSIMLTADAFISIMTDLDVLVPRSDCGHAAGTLTGSSIAWGECTAGPAGSITNFTPEESVDPDGVGCFRGYNSGGVITCSSGTNRLLQCVTSGALQPLPALNIQNGTWDQALVPFVFDSADLSTAGFQVGVPGQDLTGVTANSLLGTHLLIPNSNGGTATFIALRGELREADLCAPAPTDCSP
ncbi:MAG: hypothetical protein IPG17_30870 [Sandaracinaceae bacterium]|nr:hypothetical protein [Sandaracinaceae bacterium]MBK8410383.1 hypothetical protein [Sandaracinaceae bacterium]